MGWFSRSSATSEAQQQENVSASGSPLAQDGSTAKSANTSPEAAKAPAEATEPQIAQQQADTPQKPTFPAEMTEFDEYKAPKDVFEQYKVSDALNQLMACSSLGSNIRNYYRFGSYRDCSDKYDHLKFCLSIKTKSSQVAQVMIQKRVAELKAKKRGEPSSEDVWTARTHPPEELVELARQASAEA
ncbi:hypothetical protein B0O80DRAFT_147434 [Mortierella sp. GBAus27b]|nr:hypothetical protein BGX31_008376 [Mortierella sp. GBA43]KAI8360998.1 hypothetical protein B0O80DRAFT_147434 [Mortierella sp. GBAus27b]